VAGDEAATLVAAALEALHGRSWTADGDARAMPQIQAIQQAPEALRRATRRAALDRDLAALPDGLDTLVGARGVRLSGGQALRAALARMYVRGASLLVLDDVSSALDVETEAQLWERLFALVRDEGVACLVATHSPAVLRRAGRVITLEAGRVAGA